MAEDLQKFVHGCDQCQHWNVTKKGYNPLVSVNAMGPWDHLQVNHKLGLLTDEQGYSVCLVVVFIFTGFVILRPEKMGTMEEVARDFLRLWDGHE